MTRFVKWLMQSKSDSILIRTESLFYLPKPKAQAVLEKYPIRLDGVILKVIYIRSGIIKWFISIIYDIVRKKPLTYYVKRACKLVIDWKCTSVQKN